MNDVSAILLSSGEPFVARARQALEAQSCPLEVVGVENVTPFHRAFAAGVARVTTPFFVQVDADMVLDPTCVESLRKAMEPGVGVVCGNLRDPLSGQVEGVKLFRTEVARRIEQTDSVSSETDFVASMEREGWRLKYIGRVGTEGNAPHMTYGDHLPDYSADYTFQKYLLEGRKYRYRGARAGLFSKLHALGRSRHAMMPLARIALAHGFFLDADGDQHVPARSDARAGQVATLLAGEGERFAQPARLFPLAHHATLRDIFHTFASSGTAAAGALDGRTVHETFQRLAADGRTWPALVATLAYGHGILVAPGDRDRLAADERKLRSFVLLGLEPGRPLVRQVRARLERLYYHLPQALVPRRVVPWWRRVPRW